MATVKSKFLGKQFGRWTVVFASPTAGDHLRFTLSRKTHDGADKFITLRDNELTKIYRGERDVESYITGKQLQREKFRANVFRNNVFYVFTDGKKNTVNAQ